MPQSATAAPPKPPTPVPTPAPDPAARPAIAPGSVYDWGDRRSIGAEAASSVCSFRTEGDYVHVSSSASEASGHGWWINRTCNATTAVVTVQLQQYYSDGSGRHVGTVGTATVRSGGGAGNRSTGRAYCNTRDNTSWRSGIDVNVVGIADTWEKLTTQSRTIACRH